MIVFAHPGHWAASLMYMLPVVVLFGFFGLQKLRDMRNPHAEASRSESPDSDLTA